MAHIGRLGLVVGVSVALTAYASGEALRIASTHSAAPSFETGLSLRASYLQIDTLVSGLDTPWDLVWGPDNAIWMTERRGAISRIDVSAGKVIPIGTVPAFERSESGLLGLALHPDWKAQPYVYVMYSFALGQGIGNRLVRMRYQNGALGSEEILLDSLRGAGNHDGSRLAIGPDRLLYVTTGDATGAPQDTTSFGGKILRLTLDGKPAPGNRFKNHVYTYGHRNPQGLVFHPTTGKLYSAEHGNSTDDEVNLILPGRNYGYPAVEGFCDRPPEQTFCQQRDVVEPLTIWTPTIGIAGIDLYHADQIREWKGSMLVTSLNGRTLYRLTLSDDGTKVTSRDSLFAGEYGRLRDVLVGPRGEVYVATSNKDGRGRPGASDDLILRIRSK
jgi:glucose/arabinose dehydrogenase